MSLPTLVKTWTFQANQAVAATGTALTTNRTVWLTIKNSLKGSGSWTDSNGNSISPTNNFTVGYSCDSVTAGTANDGVDRLAAAANFVFANAGSAHSWIVFKQANISSGYQVLLSCEGTSGAGIVMMVVVSPNAGFTGGTTTARPTATDEVAIAASSTAFLSNSDSTYKIHVLASTDGQVTRVIVYLTNAIVLCWHFEKPQNPVSGWTNPSASCAINVTPSIANMVNSAQFNGRGASSMTMFCTVEGANSANLPTNMVAPNDLDSNYPMFPVGIYSTTASNRGRHGTFFDLWFGLTATANGDQYPGSGTLHQFTQMSGFIYPWNQSVCQTA